MLNKTVNGGRELRNIYDVPEALTNQRGVSPREFTPTAARQYLEVTNKQYSSNQQSVAKSPRGLPLKKTSK